MIPNSEFLCLKPTSETGFWQIQDRLLAGKFQYKTSQMYLKGSVEGGINAIYG